jgi:diamine N-acetyltransferase
MTSAWRIRKASPQDAPALAAFWRDRYGETFAHLYPPDDLAAFYAEAYAPTAIAAEVADPRFAHHLAWSEDDRLVGALKGGTVTLPLPDHSGLWELHRLYLTKDMFGTGLANRLMQLAQDEATAAGATAMVLGVFSENVRAQRFYARYGFEKIAEYQFVVGATLDDEWILRAPLPLADGARLVTEGGTAARTE